MSKEELIKALKKAGVQIDGKNSAIQTGFGVVRKIVGELRKNKLMK